MGRGSVMGLRSLPGVLHTLKIINWSLFWWWSGIQQSLPISNNVSIFIFPSSVQGQDLWSHSPWLAFTLKYSCILLSNKLLHSCEIKLLKLLNRDLYLALKNRMKPLNTQMSPSMCTKYNSGHAFCTVKEHFIGRSLEFSAFTFKFFSYSNSYVPITGYYLRHWENWSALNMGFIYLLSTFSPILFWTSKLLNIS